MHNLLAYLDTQPPNGRFQEWRIQRIEGGANNLLYRVSGPQAHFAVKFTIQDERRRAYREYQALQALQKLGLAIAPEPILLDEKRYSQPVVVQSWVEGDVTAVPPQTDEGWQQLVAYYVTLSQITSDQVALPLQPAVINFDSVPTARQQIQQQLDLIPLLHQPTALPPLLAQLEQLPLSAPGHTALCRVDGNTLNFIRRPGQWLSVDWENSGWGDPAFEIADLMSHPRYVAVSEERWQWVIQLYADLTADKTAVERIHTYYPFMLAWWIARLARMAYQIPRNLDQRLVP